MGSILLLSRDQEISLARRMERGERAILKALVKTPFTLDELVSLEALLKKTPEAFVKYFNMAEDGFSDDSLEVRRNEVLERIHKIRALSGRLTKVRPLVRNRFARGRQAVRIIRLVRELELKPEQQDRIVQAVQIRLKENFKRTSKQARKDNKAILQAIQSGRRTRERAKGDLRLGQPAAGRIDRQEVSGPGLAAPRPHPRGQHRPDAGRGEIRLPARSQILDLCDVVDPPVDHPGHRRPGPDGIRLAGPSDGNHPPAQEDLPRLSIQESGKLPNPDDSARKMNLPVNKVLEMLYSSQDPVSIETPLGENGEGSLGDLLEDKAFPSPPDTVIHINLREQIEAALRTLPERETLVLRMRYGLGDGREYTLEEVGQHFKLTRERIRQIELKALKALQLSGPGQKLKSF